MMMEEEDVCVWEGFFFACNDSSTELCRPVKMCCRADVADGSQAGDSCHQELLDGG